MGRSSRAAFANIWFFQAHGSSLQRPRLCENSEARPYVGVEREQRHSILELDDQFFDFSHRLDPFAAVTDGPISERPTRVPCFEKSLKLMARLGLPVRSSRSVIGCASMRSTSCNS